MSDWFLLVVVAVPLIIGTAMAIGEVVLRRSDLSAPRRVVWIGALVLLPFLSLLAYLVARPLRNQITAPVAMGTPDEALDRRVTAVERHVAGVIDDTEYDAVMHRTG